MKQLLANWIADNMPISAIIIGVGVLAVIMFIILIVALTTYKKKKQKAQKARSS